MTLWTITHIIDVVPFNPFGVELHCVTDDGDEKA